MKTQMTMKTQIKPMIVVLCGSALIASLLFTGCGTRAADPAVSGAGSPAAAGSSAMRTVSTTAAAQPGSPGTAVALTSQSSAAPSVSGNANFVRSVASKVEPSVVTVHTQATMRRPMTLQDMMSGGNGTEVRRGAGSGVIISADGYILTNNHVVAGAQQVNVQIGDTGYDARVVGTDPLTDIAVVKVTPPAGKVLPVAELGDSDAVQVGDWAIAVGDPLDIGTTVTLGIISAIGARGPHLEGDTASTVLQTDAAINPGNSGGALANSDGQIIGINEAIISPTGSSVGLGFAIPINAAHKIAAQLIATGHIIRPYLGIGLIPVQAVPPQARAQAGIDPSLSSSLAVVQMVPGSPAASAGLKLGDVIISADGQVLGAADALNKIVDAHKVSDKVSLKVQRGQQTMTVLVTLSERPASYGAPPPENGEQP